MIQGIRKEFFAYRNGIIAGKLRNAGDPHEVIMGCLLADVIAITSRYEKNAQLAQALWDDNRHRECRLAATMLYPIDEFDIDTARQWCSDIESMEVADVLCHRLLRHLPYAQELSQELAHSTDPLQQHIARRLKMFVIKHAN